MQEFQELENNNVQEEIEYDEYGVYLNLMRWDLIPDINLYSEQVVQVINEALSANIILGRKIDFTKSFITGTMINNYVKRGLIEAPENKRYTRIQIAKLLVISLLKQVYTTDEMVKFFKITYEAAPLERAYTSFVRLFREALRTVFLEGDLLEVEDEELDIDQLLENIRQEKFVIETKEQNLLKNITLSIANKIYVDEYLNELKKRKNK